MKEVPNNANTQHVVFKCMECDHTQGFALPLMTDLYVVPDEVIKGFKGNCGISCNLILGDLVYGEVDDSDILRAFYPQFADDQLLTDELEKPSMSQAEENKLFEND